MLSDLPELHGPADQLLQAQPRNRIHDNTPKCTVFSPDVSFWIFLFLHAMSQHVPPILLPPPSPNLHPLSSPPVSWILIFLKQLLLRGSVLFFSCIISWKPPHDSMREVPQSLFYRRFTASFYSLSISDLWDQILLCCRYVWHHRMTPTSILLLCPLDLLRKPACNN